MKKKILDIHLLRLGGIESSVQRWYFFNNRFHCYILPPVWNSISSDGIYLLCLKIFNKVFSTQINLKFLHILQLSTKNLVSPKKSILPSHWKITRHFLHWCVCGDRESGMTLYEDILVFTYNNIPNDIYVYKIY